MRLRMSFSVAVEPAEAFDFFADARNALISHPPGTTLEQIPPGDIDVGTEYVFSRPDLPFRSTVTRYDRPSGLQFENAFEGQPTTRSTWAMTRVDGGTHVEVETTSFYVGPRWLRPFAGLLTLAAWPLLMIKMWRVRRGIIRALEAHLSPDADQHEA